MRNRTTNNKEQSGTVRLRRQINAWKVFLFRLFACFLIFLRIFVPIIREKRDMMSMHKPRGMAGGGLVCLALVVVGALLQMAVGPVRWDGMAWPVNGFVLAVLLFGIVLMHLCRGRVGLFLWMATLQAGIPAMVACALMTILMGVTRQVPSGHQPADPFGITSMLSFWPFVLVYLWLVVLVGMVCLSRLRAKWRNIWFQLNHLGLFIALVSGTLGNADMQRLHMMVREGSSERYAVDARHRPYELPFSITLHDFALVEEPELKFSSDVSVKGRKGLSLRDTILVNKPLSVGGWKIYQYGYDESKGSLSDISILELVRDPWLPYVYLGIFMMLAGAGWGILKR
jgi:hypothetical protein